MESVRREQELFLAEAEELHIEERAQADVALHNAHLVLRRAVGDVVRAREALHRSRERLAAMREGREHLPGW